MGLGARVMCNDVWPGRLTWSGRETKTVGPLSSSLIRILFGLAWCVLSGDKAQELACVPGLLLLDGAKLCRVIW